ncbi:uncharacterized protein LOC129752541 [Uranotaenia lowii]|uniref:uncharacterized protein LOC129752541 n=1 Tax=Uranotaenia lowii TaxID=190385 RepID=UPI002478848D|nr:uncharacterized protein LOC129752541 [Uranotaenia lowii]
MSDLEVLNIFNRFLVSCIRFKVVNGAPVVYYDDVVKNFIVPAAISCVTGYAGIMIVRLNFDVFKNNLIHLITILRYELQKGFYTRILLTCAIFVEFHFFIQLLFVQGFGEMIVHRYSILSNIVQQQSTKSEHLVRKVLWRCSRLFDLLVKVRQQLSDIFGLCFMLSTLIMFFNCAIIFYTTALLIEEHGLHMTFFLNTLNLIPTSILFFGQTYTFERVIVEIPCNLFFAAKDDFSVPEHVHTQKVSKLANEFLVWQIICTCGKRSARFVIQDTLNGP